MSSIMLLTFDLGVSYLPYGFFNTSFAFKDFTILILTGDERLSNFLEELTDGALARNYRLMSFENEFWRGILSVRIYF